MEATLPDYIEHLHEKRFKREKPKVAKSLKQQLKDDEIRRKAKKKAKDARRAEKANAENSVSELTEYIEHSQRLRVSNIGCLVFIFKSNLHYQNVKLIISSNYGSLKRDGINSLR